jgi:hypothetical protein
VITGSIGDTAWIANIERLALTELPLKNLPFAADFVVDVCVEIN